MSHSSVIDVQCGSCRRVQKIQVWNSVNVSLSPDLKQQLLSHELNTLRCHCGTVSHIPTNLLYHDMNRGYQIWLRENPGQSEGDASEEIIQSMGARFLPNARLRFVATNNEMIEKVRIFDAELDDHVVELIKLMFLPHFSSEAEFDRTDIYFVEAVKGETLSFAVFFDDASTRNGVTVPYKEGYMSIERRLRDMNPSPRTRNGSFAWVDREYALGIAKDMTS